MTMFVSMPTVGWDDVRTILTNSQKQAHFAKS
jgi:hypothetical protein